MGMRSGVFGALTLFAATFDIPLTLRLRRLHVGGDESEHAFSIVA